MATYQVTAPDGSSYEVSGDSDKVQNTIQSILSPQEQGPIEKAIPNILPDIAQMVKNTVANTQQFAPLAGGDAATMIPGLIKQGVGLLSHPKESAQLIARPLLHPIDYFEEHPVQQMLNALGAVQAGASGLGSALDAIPATENMLPSIERVANNQTLKGFGGSFGQIKQMAEGRGGREALDRAAEFARNNGLSDVLTTGIGREKMLKAFTKSSGEKVGVLREKAGLAPADTINEIVQDPKIDKYLGEGAAAKQLGGIDTALADIQEIAGKNPTHADLSKAATYINKMAAGDKLYQPVTAETEIANILSRKNDAGIAQTLGSEKAKQYVDALEQQHQLHPLEHLSERGELREAGGRGGLGVQMVQRIADEFGYRLTAKTASALHDLLVGNGANIGAFSVPNSMTNQIEKPSVFDLISQLKQKFNQPAGRK